MMIDAGELKRVLLDALQEWRDKARGVSNKQALSIVDNSVSLLERLVVFIDKAIKEDKIDMAAFKSQLVKGIVRLEEIKMHSDAGEMEKKILEIVDRLRPNEAAEIDNSSVTYQHIANKISKMRKAKKISEKIRVVKNKEQFYIAMKP